MKLEVGMYVKTEYGISKIEKIKEDQIHKTIWCTVDKAQYHSFLVRKQEILKASHNIIDLIEVGDYVNGLLVQSNDYNFDKPIKIFSYLRFGKEDIKSIVTKEQFESCMYKVGE